MSNSRPSDRAIAEAFRELMPEMHGEQAAEWKYAVLDRAAELDASGPREPERIAPVQGYAPGIPWSMHMEAYEAYAKKWAPQPALITGGCRGGFHVGELDEFIPGWRERLTRPPVESAPGFDYVEASRRLWALLDDIDTLDDACRDSDDVFRRRVRRVQQRRHDVMTGEHWGSLPIAAPAAAQENAS